MGRPTTRSQSAQSNSRDAPSNPGTVTTPQWQSDHSPELSPLSSENEAETMPQIIPLDAHPKRRRSSRLRQPSSETQDSPKGAHPRTPHRSRSNFHPYASQSPARSSPRRSRRRDHSSSTGTRESDEEDPPNPDLIGPKNRSPRKGENELSWKVEIAKARSILSHLPSSPQPWRPLHPALIKYMVLCEERASLAKPDTPMNRGFVLTALSPRLRRRYRNHPE